MQPTALSPELLATIPDITARLARILAALAALIARAFLRHPVHVTHTIALCNYISRTTTRFTRALDRLAQGKPRPHTPRANRKPAATANPRKPRGFPITHGWLRATLVQPANALGSQLTHLLDQPETKALLQAAPQAARVLRPLCHFLGIEPEALRRPPRPRAQTTSPDASRATRQSRLRAEPPGEPLALFFRPVQPLCPRLLDRWPFSTSGFAKRA